MAQYQDIKAILIEHQRRDKIRTAASTIALIKIVCKFITEHCAESVTGKFISENLEKSSEELSNLISQPSCNNTIFYSTLYSARVHLHNAADLIKPSQTENLLSPQE